MVGVFPISVTCACFSSLSPSAPLFCFHHLSFVPLLTSKPPPMRFTQPQVCLRAVDVHGPGPAGDRGSACLQRHTGVIDSLFQPTGLLPACVDVAGSPLAAEDGTFVSALPHRDKQTRS